LFSPFSHLGEKGSAKKGGKGGKLSIFLMTKGRKKEGPFSKKKKGEGKKKDAPTLL